MHSDPLQKREKKSRHSIAKIRSDHSGEFENEDFNEFCLESGIQHSLFTPRTPQQNCVIGRKNKIIQEMTCIMLMLAQRPFTLVLMMTNL